MSSALCVFIHASETGHAEGVPIAPSRGRSVEFPLEGNHIFLLEDKTTIVLVFYFILDFNPTYFVVYQDT